VHEGEGACACVYVCEHQRDVRMRVRAWIGLEAMVAHCLSSVALSKKNECLVHTGCKHDGEDSDYIAFVIAHGHMVTW
jgi:hypothetical protein